MAAVKQEHPSATSGSGLSLAAGLKIGGEQTGSLCKKDAEVHGQGGSWGCGMRGLHCSGCASGLQDLLVFGVQLLGVGSNSPFLRGGESETGSGWKLVMGMCAYVSRAKRASKSSGSHSKRRVQAEGIAAQLCSWSQPARPRQRGFFKGSYLHASFSAQKATLF